MHALQHLCPYTMTLFASLQGISWREVNGNVLTTSMIRLDRLEPS